MHHSSEEETADVWNTCYIKHIFRFQGVSASEIKNIYHRLKLLSCWNVRGVKWEQRATRSEVTQTTDPQFTDNHKPWDIIASLLMSAGENEIFSDRSMNSIQLEVKNNKTEHRQREASQGLKLWETIRGPTLCNFRLTFAWLSESKFRFQNWYFTSYCNPDNCVMKLCLKTGIKSDYWFCVSWDDVKMLKHSTPKKHSLVSHFCCNRSRLQRHSFMQSEEFSPLSRNIRISMIIKNVIPTSWSFTCCNDTLQV